jgi:hypothetical protein
MRSESAFMWSMMSMLTLSYISLTWPLQWTLWETLMTNIISQVSDAEARAYA